MKFQLIGVNHKTAPVEVRERLAIPESRLPEALKRLAAHPGVEEGIILSTCNRVEVLKQKMAQWTCAAFCEITFI
jgi:glutamyl-tRNA reductase